MWIFKRAHNEDKQFWKEKKGKILTKEQQEPYENAKICYICKEISEIFEKKKNSRVRDHCHYTGESRGAAHSKSNLKHNVLKKIPIAFHNGSNYGYHFIKKS